MNYTMLSPPAGYIHTPHNNCFIIFYFNLYLRKSKYTIGQLRVSRITLYISYVQVLSYGTKTRARAGVCDYEKGCVSCF